MATVTLDQLWIHDADDLSSYVRLRYVDEQVDPSRNVDVRAYTAGRLRAVTRPAVRRQATWQVGLLSKADRDTLEGWIGQTVMVRSPSGEKFFGVMDGLPSEHVRKRGDWDAKVTVRLVTASEEV